MKVPNSHAYILFEVMIAVAIFSIAAVGLANSLNATIEAANYLDRQTAIRYGLESILAEAKQKPKRDEMVIQIEDEVLGVNYRTEIEPLSLVNQKGDALDGLYRLIAIAEYHDAHNERREQVEVYVHRP